MQDQANSGQFVSDEIEQTEQAKKPLFIEGGEILRGEIELQGAKNTALPAIAAALLIEGKTHINNLPEIDDIRTNLKIIERLGAKIEWTSPTDIIIDATNLLPHDLLPEETAKTTASKYFIPALINRFGSIRTGASGGDHISDGDRYEFSHEMLKQYNAIGIEGRELTDKIYEFESSAKERHFQHLENRYLGTTIQVILNWAKGKKGQVFILQNPSIEPEVFTIIDSLNAAGAKIRYDADGALDGTDTLIIKSQEALNDTNFDIPSDPNELVSYAVFTLITNGEVTINKIDSSKKIDQFIKLLESLDADFTYNQEQRNLTIRPSLDRLKPVNLNTDFWPKGNCHTDWQEILTPLLMKIEGESTIKENVYPQRFGGIEALTKLGGNCELDYSLDEITRQKFLFDNQAHGLKIHGGNDFFSEQITMPEDIRGATGVLAAALSAKGASVLSDSHHLNRGLGNLTQKLTSIGAKIKY